jgi:hypothetical protein
MRRGGELTRCAPQPDAVGVMVRRPAFAAAWGLLLSACALDLAGLGTAPDGAAPPAQEAAADQSVGQGETGEAGDETGEIEAEGPDAQGPGGDAAPFVVDGASPVDGAGAKDAHVEAGATCDEDGDGYLAMGACGGNDCCDTDAHVHPGQTAYFTQQGACGGYDYDCNGMVVAEYGAANCQWSLFSCNGNGFAPPIPACGDFGTFTSCNLPWYDPITCDSSNAQQAQACR